MASMARAGRRSLGDYAAAHVARLFREDDRPGPHEFANHGQRTSKAGTCGNRAQGRERLGSSRTQNCKPYDKTCVCTVWIIGRTGRLSGQWTRKRKSAASSVSYPAGP